MRDFIPNVVLLIVFIKTKIYIVHTIRNYITIVSTEHVNQQVSRACL